MKKATIGWLGLAAYIVIYDIYATIGGHETLSAAFWRGMSNPKTAWIVLGLTASVNKHLIAPDILPQIDLIKHAGNTFGRVHKV